MKKYWLVLFILLFNMVGFAQKTRVVTDSKTNEVYSVLIDSPDVKHGSYKKLINLLVIEKGYYNHGIKDSIWTIFRNDKKAEEGRLKNNIKVGVWNYFEKGKLIQKYDEDKGELISFKLTNPADSNKYYKVLHQGESILVHLDSPPMYKGGDEAMKAFIESHKVIPPSAISQQKKGNVIITCTLNKNGKIDDFNIKQSQGKELDEEAIRLIKLSEPNWIIGILKKRKVNVEIEISVSI